uniref:Uncharacterized protein n=1 Tax=Anguilla anguilla TaxID=7936 RepID=A0A0E9RMT8_ANGAN
MLLVLLCDPYKLFIIPCLNYWGHLWYSSLCPV